MIRVWAVMRRDLLRISRNPFTLVGSVLMPLAYLLILGNSLQGLLTGLRLGIVSQDGGTETRALMGALQAIARGPRTLVLVSEPDAAQGMEALRAGDVNGLLVVPPNFSRDLERGLATAAGAVRGQRGRHRGDVHPGGRAGRPGLAAQPVRPL